MAAVVLNVPVTVMRPAVVIALAAETTPLMVRVPKPFAPFKILTVAAAPVIVTVLVVPVNTDPAPDVSQLPLTVHEPDAVIVPSVPPSMVTLATLTVDVPAVSVPPLFTDKLPPVSARFAVARVALLLSVRAPAQRRPLVAIVKVAAAVGLNWMLLNSGTGKLPKVMTRDAPALNTTVPVPAPQEAEVEESVQAPPIVHVSVPNAI